MVHNEVNFRLSDTDAVTLMMAICHVAQMTLYDLNQAKTSEFSTDIVKLFDVLNKQYREQVDGAPLKLV